MMTHFTFCCSVGNTDNYLVNNKILFSRPVGYVNLDSKFANYLMFIRVATCVLTNNQFDFYSKQFTSTGIVLQRKRHDLSWAFSAVSLVRANLDLLHTIG